ncbi:MAG: NifU family protein [Bacteroidia bacterium]|nr:NifU family protein [Bacteroidia bacterium]
MKTTLQDIAPHISSIREYLALDGGDIELVRLSPDASTLYVRLLGSCRTCDLSPTTIQLGVLEPLKRHFPSLQAIEVLKD